MNTWKKIIQWEHKLESRSAIQLFKMVGISFGISLLFGTLLSSSIVRRERRHLETVNRDISQLEKARMDKRVQLLRSVRYTHNLPY